MNELTFERAKELFDYDPDTGVITRKSPVGHVADDGYRRISADGKPVLAHRLAWLLTHGKFPNALVDHINRVRDDNRIENLREATHSENHQNQVGARKSSRSGVRGVSWCARDGKWKAAIRVKGKEHFLGRFETPEEAAEAYAIARAYKHPYAP